MDIATEIAGLVSPDRLVSLLITIACIAGAIQLTKFAAKTALTVVAMLAVLYFLDPGLYVSLIEFITGLWAQIRAAI